MDQGGVKMNPAYQEDEFIDMNVLEKVLSDYSGTNPKPVRASFQRKTSTKVTSLSKTGGNQQLSKKLSTDHQVQEENGNTRHDSASRQNSNIHKPLAKELERNEVQSNERKARSWSEQIYEKTDPEARSRHTQKRGEVEQYRANMKCFLIAACILISLVIGILVAVVVLIML